jgi:hypothetical protein
VFLKGRLEGFVEQVFHKRRFGVVTTGAFTSPGAVVQINLTTADIRLDAPLDFRRFERAILLSLGIDHQILLGIRKFAFQEAFINSSELPYTKGTEIHRSDNLRLAG